MIEEYEKRTSINSAPDSTRFPLIASSIYADEIVAAVDSVLSGQLTMGKHVREFELEFAKKVGAPFAVMCNSGSSANLLALATATNQARTHRLCASAEVLIPAVCWSTSLWPILQMNLKPVFVDVDPLTLNVNLTDLRAKITGKTAAVMLVHVLGNMCNMDAVMDVCEQHRLLLIEDTCESLGSTYNGKLLGTFGSFGCFSFYFSHHITTGEGGMVVCRSQEDADLLRCLRAHGWTRELSNKDAYHRMYPEVDSRFMFVNLGFNLRPMEISGAIGKCQLRRLEEMNDNRISNRAKLIDALKMHPNWAGQLRFPVGPPTSEPAWFVAAASASKFAELPELHITAKGAPTFLANSSSNSLTCLPMVSCPDKTESTAATISSA